MAEEIPETERIRCICCGRIVDEDESTPMRALRPSLADYVRSRIVDVEVADDDEICRACFFRFRTEHMLKELEAERGQLSALEREAAEKAAEHETIARRIDEDFARGATTGQRLADTVARVGGSWPFVVGFLVFLGIWMFVNVFVLVTRSFDPYPFILLNLVLSCIAALQAPIIMMSQNRAAARDRMQADQDYRVNLKAELEIAALHEKVDHLLHAQWENLIDMQQTQIELLQELAKYARPDNRRPPI